MAALLLMCDPRDLGVALSEEIAGGLKAFEPNLYLYDAYPGGIGQKRAAVPPRSAIAPPDCRTARRMRVRGGLSVVCRSHRRDRRAR